MLCVFVTLDQKQISVDQRGDTVDSLKDVDSEMYDWIKGTHCVEIRYWNCDAVALRFD